MPPAAITGIGGRPDLSHRRPYAPECVEHVFSEMPLQAPA